MRASNRIILLDVETIQNKTDGSRSIIIANRVPLLVQKETVGMNTYWSATANNVQLKYTFVVRRRMYSNQKYVYSEGEVYEIKNTSKGATLDQLKLNVIEISDSTKKEEIINALGLV